MVLATPQHSILWVARALSGVLDRALVLTRASARAFSSASALALARALARDLDLAPDLALDELRCTQFNFRTKLINYLKTTLPAVRSRSRSDLQFLIERLQLLNDRLEGTAEPVEAIALVRREQARK